MNPTRQRMRRVRAGLPAAALVLALLALPTAASAAVALRQDEPALAARIDGAALHAFTLDVQWRQARGRDAQAARTATLEELVLNRLLVAAARQRFDEAQLFASQRVAFAREVALDDQLVALLRSQYGKELEQVLSQLPGGALEGLVSGQLRPEADVLDAIFGKPGQLKLEYTLNDEQQARARKVVLLRYTLPSGAGEVTLYDVYRRQNVQGRVALFQRQADFLAQQARQDLAGRFVLDWSSRRFGAAAVADLRRALAERSEVLALQQWHGIGDDIDSISPLLRQLAAQVSAAQVAAYYQQHRAEFARVERVKARHIRLADEQTAGQVYAALNQGVAFAALARRYSRAADAASGGELGWIVHEGKPDWLQQLVLAQPEGAPSRPFRLPVGPQEDAAWEIVQVQQKVLGYQAADSDAVRYAASNAIARSSALAQWQALRQQVLRAAQIDINRRQLDLPLQLLKEAP